MSVHVPAGDPGNQPGHQEIIGRDIAGRDDKENCKWLRP
jgi:hypothetical protein